MREALVWVDGALVPASRAHISALDRGFRGGEGVFTTLRADRGRVFRLGDHLARLLGDAAVLHLDLDATVVAAAVAATVAANDHLGASLAVRVTCSAGPVDLTEAFPASGARLPTVVVTAQAVGSGPGAARGHPVPWPRPMAQVKSTSYLTALLAQQQARAAGATDALLCTGEGWVLEAASANLFAVCAGTVLTPPVADGILPGVTRGAVLETLEALGLAVTQRSPSLTELSHAQEAWLTSSVRGIRALTHLDTAPIGTGRPGPITEQVRAAYRDLLDREATVPDLRS